MIRDAFTRLVDFLMSKPTEQATTEAPAQAIVPPKPASKASTPSKRRRKLKGKGRAYAGPARLDSARPLLDQLRGKQ